MKIAFIILFVFLSLTSAFADVASDLEKIYRSNPGLVTENNPKVIEEAAERILKNKESIKDIKSLFAGDIDTFNTVRNQTLAALKASPPAGLKKVVVSGQSVTGMMAAAIAAQSGHQVNVYDTRMSYTREIQWSVRQTLPDMLASIDPKLAERYIKEVAQNLDRGYSMVSDNGKVQSTSPGEMIKPDPRRIPHTADAMLNGKSVATVQTKAFEKIMHEYLSNHPNVTQRKGKVEFGPLDPVTGEHIVEEYEDITPKGQKEKVYKKIASGNPIAVVAEGAGSSNRTSLGIKSVPTSPKRLQVAGIMEIENAGEIATHYRMENSQRLITGSMGTKGTEKRWVVGDIDPEKIRPDFNKFGVDTTKAEYINERARLLEIEFKRMAALNMRSDMSKIIDKSVSGAIEGQKLQTFELQQHMSTKGASGNNVLLLGDAVGNGHWSVGGGVHIGGISHGERFKQYLTVVDGGGEMSAAASKYSSSVIEDSRAWGERGLHYFYDNLKDADSTKAFNQSLDLYMEGKVSTPERALQLMLPDGRSSVRLKNIKLKCNDIVSRVLGEI